MIVKEWCDCIEYRQTTNLNWMIIGGKQFVRVNLKTNVNISKQCQSCGDSLVFLYLLLLLLFVIAYKIVFCVCCCELIWIAIYVKAWDLSQDNNRNLLCENKEEIIFENNKKKEKITTKISCLYKIAKIG